MSVPKKAIWLPATLIAALLILSGCQKNVLPQSQQPVSSQPGERIPLTAEDVLPKDSSQKQRDPIEISSDDPAPAIPAEADDTARIEGHESDDLMHDPPADKESEAEVTGEEERRAESVSPSGGTNRPDAEEKSSLRVMGLAIGQSLQDVNHRFGQPNEQYHMHDPDGTIIVYEYDGFTTGFNEKNRIEFIDIYSAEIDPALQGVRVGSAASDVEKTYGPPTSRSEYVLNYMSGGVVMKFDLDPVSTQVLSIKLFRED